MISFTLLPAKDKSVSKITDGSETLLIEGLCDS